MLEICLQQATQCLKDFGFVLAINTYDNTQYTDLEMTYLENCKNYQIVDLPSVFVLNDSEEKKVIIPVI